MFIIEEYISSVQETLAQLVHAPIQKTIDWLHEARLSGRQIFIMGNGGSAATASHFVCDLAKNTRDSALRPFRVIGLNDNVAILTAYSNDEGYENALAQQLRNLVQPQDIVIAISTSGNSPNILNAIKVAKKKGAKTISFTGLNGGQLARMTDLDLHVPSHHVDQVEDIHLILEHLICKALRNYPTNGQAHQQAPADFLVPSLENEWS